MKKALLIAMIAILSISLSSETLFAQKYDMRTKVGKAAAKREKKIDAAVGAANMGKSLMKKEEREKGKKSVKKNSKKVKESFKDNFNKVKDGWKNRKKD